MGYLTNLINSLIGQANTATEDASRAVIVNELATAQRAAGSTGVTVSVGYLTNLKASLESQIDTATTEAEKLQLIRELAVVQGAVSSSGGGGSLPTPSYSVSRALAAGDNIITHNLALTSPFAVTVVVKDGVTGSQIVPRIKNETTNTCTLSLITAFASTSIKIN